MDNGLRLMAVLAHPDDEALGFGGTLAKCASEGIQTSLVTATGGQRGRYRGLRLEEDGHPGSDALKEIRERELRDAAVTLGIGDLSLLGYPDQELDRADPSEVLPQVVRHLRRVRPHVVLTFGPDGAYGHPDHVAISQLTTAAVIAAADFTYVSAAGVGADVPHAVSKLYYLAWPASTWSAYEEAFRTLVSRVDGIDRHAVPWPDWAITTVIDTRAVWQTVWDAVACHQSQVTAYERLKHLGPGHHEALWGWQWFYRAFSLVNGGRQRETDLFEGLRHPVT